MSSEQDDILKSKFRSRCAYYRFALHQRPTPLFEQLVLLSWGYHQAALALPKISQFIVDGLDNVHQEIENHWSKIHNDFRQHIHLMMQLVMFQEILASQLLYDYAETHPTTDRPGWVKERAALIKQHRISAGGGGGNANQEGEGDDEGIDEQDYQKIVVRPLEELMLDAGHVEKKLIAAAEAAEQQDGQNPGSRIRQLIDQCDWPSLAENLVKDRRLLLQLWKLHQNQDPASPQLSLDKDKAGRALNGINKIQCKYFAELSSPTTFALSKHAMELSMTPGTEKLIAIESESDQLISSGSRSLWVRVKGIADMIRGHLGELPKHEGHSADAEKGTWDEMEPLIESESEKGV